VDETFGELPGDSPVNGATGNPPQFPILPSSFSPSISNLLGSFVGSPGPIYSGIPINQNSAPLSLDAGRAVTGGYDVSNTSSVEASDEGCECECDCDCSTPVDPYSGSIMEIPVQEVVEGDCEACTDVIQEGVILDEGVVVEGENCDQCEVVEEVDSCSFVPESGEGRMRPSFLKRFGNWFGR